MHFVIPKDRIFWMNEKPRPKYIVGNVYIKYFL